MFHDYPALIKPGVDGGIHTVIRKVTSGNTGSLKVSGLQLTPISF